MIGILTGDVKEDIGEYLRLACHEIAFAKRAISDARADSATGALKCAERYLGLARTTERAGA